MSHPPAFRLAEGRTWRPDGALVDEDVTVARGAVRMDSVPDARELDATGLLLLPGFVNAHDHLDACTLPLMGQPPYPNGYAWARAMEAEAGASALQKALAVPLVDRLFLGGMRNLLAGVTAVLHHNPYHRSLARDDFPVRVQDRYDIAHSPGVTVHLRKSYRTTDRRIPWIIHAAEGTDTVAAAEVSLLRDANVLRQNTVIVHGMAIDVETAGVVARAHACVVWCPEEERRLYAATTPVARLREAGVRVALGSDGTAAGGRDFLSALKAARREEVLDDNALLDMATRGSAEVARLPVGGFVEDAPPDLVAVRSLDALLSGDRRAIALVVAGARRLYGERALLPEAPAPALLRVDGAERALEPELARRLFGLLKAHPSLRSVPWLSGIEFS